MAYFGVAGKNCSCVVLHPKCRTQVDKRFVIFAFIFRVLLDDLIDLLLIVSQREDIDVFWLGDGYLLGLPSPHAIWLQRIMPRWNTDRRLEISIPLIAILLPVCPETNGVLLIMLPLILSLALTLYHLFHTI